MELAPNAGDDDLVGTVGSIAASAVAGIVSDAGRSRVGSTDRPARPVVRGIGIYDRSTRAESGAKGLKPTSFVPTA